MVSEKDKFDIERWVDGQLSSAEMKVLRGRAETEEALALAIRHAFGQETWRERETAIQKTMDYLRHLEEKSVPLPAPAPRPVPVYRHWWAVAAVLLPLFLAGWWFLHHPGNLDIQHRPLDANMSVVSEAVQAYNQGDFKVALPLIRQQLSGDRILPQWRLAEIVSLLELGNYGEASNGLDQLAATAPLYADAVAFYRGLIAYRLGDFEVAKDQLNRVPENNYYRPFAEDLLKKI